VIEGIGSRASQDRSKPNKSIKRITRENKKKKELLTKGRSQLLRWLTSSSPCWYLQSSRAGPDVAFPAALLPTQEMRRASYLSIIIPFLIIGNGGEDRSFQVRTWETEL
jgi:hypothetical protein